MNFEQRLRSLKERRQGTRERAIYEAFDSATARNKVILGDDIRVREAYETLNEKPGTKYAVGAMAPVSAQSTEISKREGQRVADSLIKSLSSLGIGAESRLQGSVALDIHIEGHSDVDMLIIITKTIMIEAPRVVPNSYQPATDNRPMEKIVEELRLQSELILPKNFPAADVNTSSPIAISIEGGSLLRKVDIVPSCWNDTVRYQETKNEADRGVYVYNKKENSLSKNLPFTHKKKIDERDRLYNGNLKRVVRLIKNVVADMPDQKKNIAKKLTSYDVAAIAYHINAELDLPPYLQLGLVEVSRKFLRKLIENPSLRDQLDVPDGTRKIFNSKEKTAGLYVVHEDIEALTFAIAKELSPIPQYFNSESLLSKEIL